MSALTIVFLGPPGVGKGTQGQLLAEARGWERLVTGDLLREAKEADTELGRLARQYMEAGELVPDEVVLDLVGEKVAALGAETGIVFDGFPRTRAQAEGLDRLLGDRGRAVDAVVLLAADEEEIVHRLSGRRTCAECGAVYNVHVNPPQESERCTHCGGPLTRRSDDEPDTIRNRLRVYERETAPLVSFYEEGEPEVVKVSGMGAIDEVHAELQRRLDEAVAA